MTVTKTTKIILDRSKLLGFDQVDRAGGAASLAKVGFKPAPQR